MDRDLLPIGSVIELPDNIKLVIIGYEDVTKEKITYICGGYPSYLMTDFIPFKRLKEYKEKYQSYNTERNIDHNSEYKIIHEGYKNQKFYDIINRMKE